MLEHSDVENAVSYIIAEILKNLLSLENVKSKLISYIIIQATDVLHSQFDL